MKILIVEDEQLVAEGLKKLLREIDPAIEVLAVIPSVAEAKKWFGTHQEPDLILMDIQLSDGVSFDIFKTVKVECPVIFATAYDEYAIRAFQLNSLDYLMKPVDKADLKRALDKYHKWTHLPAGFEEQINNFLKDLSAGPSHKKYKERFMVHTGKTLMPLGISHVAALMKEELIFLLSREGEKFVTDFETLDGLEELLDPTIFFRANRQYIIHIDAVGQIRPHFSGKLSVSIKGFNNLEVDVSREKASSFKHWLNS